MSKREELKRASIIALCEEAVRVYEDYQDKDELPDCMKTLVDTVLNAMANGDTQLQQLIEDLMEENQAVNKIMNKIYQSIDVFMFMKLLGLE